MGFASQTSLQTFTKITGISTNEMSKLSKNMNALLQTYPTLKNEVEFRKTFSKAAKAKLFQDRNKLKMFGIQGECEEVRGNCIEDAMFESFMTVYPAVLANVPGIAAWATRAIYNGYKCNRDYNTCRRYKTAKNYEIKSKKYFDSYNVISCIGNVS